MPQQRYRLTAGAGHGYTEGDERAAPNTSSDRPYLASHEIEGIVWWRVPGDPDCDMAKIKRRDFKLPWPVKRG